MTRPRGASRKAAAAVFGVLLTQLIVASVFVIATTGKSTPPWQLHIAVVGDSIAAGELNRAVWPTLLAQRTGWSVSNFALPGAGFLADGRGGYAFTYQVDRAQASDPDIILVATGQADNGLADMGRVRIGALDALNKIKLGGQRGLVIGPTWYTTPVPGEVRRVSDAVRAIADQTATPFLDAIDPPWLTENQMQRDFRAPTDAGQSIIADKVAVWLRTKVAG